MERVIIKMFENIEISYVLILMMILFVAYRLFLFFWDLHKKHNEIKEEMDEYINSLIDIKLSPVHTKTDIMCHRIDNIDKLRLPTKLIAIETKLEILTSNIEAGFKRIEEDIRSFHRKG